MSEGGAIWYIIQDSTLPFGQSYTVMIGVWSLQKRCERRTRMRLEGTPTTPTSIATSVCRTIFPSFIHLCAIKLLLP